VDLQARTRAYTYTYARTNIAHIQCTRATHTQRINVCRQSFERTRKHPHTQTLPKKHSHTQTLSRTYTCKHSLTHTRKISFSLTLELSHSHTQTLSNTLTRKLSLSVPLPLAVSFARALSQFQCQHYQWYGQNSFYDDSPYPGTPLQSPINKLQTHCNTLQIASTHCITLQHPATPCITLQHTATRSNTLQHTVAWQRTHCNTLQHTATHCNTLQHTATHGGVAKKAHHFYHASQFPQMSPRVRGLSEEIDFPQTDLRK